MVARVLTERMRVSLGQPLIMENVAGANGTIATARVVRATPDGYTLILGHWQTHVVNGATYTLPFDVVNDFVPIALIADCPVWLVGRSSLAAQNLQELIAWMKESPGKPTVGIGGAGGGADVVGTYFQKNTGTRLQFVPYRGAAPALTMSPSAPVSPNARGARRITTPGMPPSRTIRFEPTPTT